MIREESDAEMDVGCCSCSYFNCLLHIRRRKKKMLETNFDSLPDDVVFNILVQLPAPDIYNSSRLVCRKWYHIINSPSFIHSHLHHSTSGLLIYNMCDLKSPPTFVAMRKDRIEVSKLSCKRTEFIKSSCNGLILLPGRSIYEDLYITNPVTKRHFALPTDVLIRGIRSAAMVYAPTSMAYKVAYLFHDSNSESTGCAMLTVGIDKSWRRIAYIKHLSVKAKGLVGPGGRPLTVEGFVIWAQKSNVLILNMETEIITQILAPQVNSERLYYYLSGGSYLSLLVGRTEFSWEVWEMKPESGEWRKLPNIDFEAPKCTFQQLRLKHYNSLSFTPKPVGWLKYQEVLVFHVCVRWGFKVPSKEGLCIAYNIHTQEIESFELDSRWSYFFVHRNTLVSLNGC